MVSHFFPNNCHNIKRENISPEWWLFCEAEILHLEMKIRLAVPCESFFFFKLSSSFITGGRVLWGAGVERRGAREWAFLLLLPLFLLPVAPCETSAMPGAGIAQVWFPVFIDFFFHHCFRFCWLRLCTTRMWVVPSAAWPHLPLAARLCAPRRCCTMEDAAWQMGFQTMSPPAHPISARALVSLFVKLGK